MQALRALAAVLVMLYHGTTLIRQETGYTYLANIFTVGFMGVDIFFVLSGFIIFYTYTSKTVHAGGFLKKRFIRVVPIYWIVIIGLILIHVKYPASNQAELNTACTIAASFTLYPSKLYVLGVAWTLTYEILFYIVFALTASCNIKWFFYTFLAWCVLIIAFYILQIKSSIFAVNALTNPVILNFGFGCIIAYLFKKHQTLKHWGWVACFGFVLLLVTCLTYYFAVSKDARDPAYTSDMSRVYLFGIPSAILICGLLYFKRHVPKLFVAIGDASYSLYLIHAALITFMLRFFLKAHLLQTQNRLNVLIISTIIFAMTIGISLLFYKYIEKPLIKQLNKRKSNNTVW
ncbi:acyltransferase family protein [Mucilaginibacter sp.]|uniref:acyltransferase family protein n=1 Tax=Mucilaginibacter sp. TaxID=1882438 RepID=UPI0035BC1047